MQRVAGQKRRRLRPTRVSPPEGAPLPSAEQPRPSPGPIRSWFDRQRDDLIRDGLIGFFVLVIGTAAVFVWDGRMAERQEVLENTRFVRQTVIDSADVKAFRGFNLQGASLPGLDLSCKNSDAQPPIGCADLAEADLGGANLYGADLGGANLFRANLSGANLATANLTDTNLIGADLTGADLSVASLSGADFSFADLTDADLQDACPRPTPPVWPEGFSPSVRLSCSALDFFGIE